MTGGPRKPRRIERRHHKAATLPPSILDELQERLRRGEPYEHVEAWLVSIGHPVGKSSLHRWHRFLREGMERIRERTVIAEKIVAANAGADPSQVQNAAYQVAMQQALQFLIDLEAGDTEMTVSQLAKLMHALGALGGTATQLSKYIAEQKRLRAKADRKVEAMAKDGALPASAVETIKRLYGLGEPVEG